MDWSRFPFHLRVNKNHFDVWNKPDFNVTVLLFAVKSGKIYTFIDRLVPQIYVPFSLWSCLSPICLWAYASWFPVSFIFFIEFIVFINWSCHAGFILYFSFMFLMKFNYCFAKNIKKKNICFKSMWSHPQVASQS